MGEEQKSVKKKQVNEIREEKMEVTQKNEDKLKGSDGNQ